MTTNVEDEGVFVATASTLNFIGDGVTASDAGGGVVDVTIPTAPPLTGGGPPDGVVAAALGATYTWNPTADIISLWKKISQVSAGDDVGWRPEIYEQVSVTDFGAVGDGTDETAKIQAAADFAIAKRMNLWFPPAPVEYLITSTITFTAAQGLRIKGDKAKVRYDSTAHIGFTFTGGIDDICIEGMYFQGDASDDQDVNLFAALWFDQDSSDVDVTRNVFDHCLALQFVDSSQSGRMSFSHNRVFSAPNAITGPSYSTVEFNWFVCDAVVTTRSHAVYFYGQAEKIIIQGNLFLNIANEDIQIRAGTATYQQKETYILSNNIHVNSGAYSIWYGSDTDVEVNTVIIEGCHFRNCFVPINLQGSRFAVVDGNTFEWDWRYAGPIGIPGVGSAISIASGLAPGEDPRISSMGNIVSNNRIINRHPFYGILQITAPPANGDTTTVGTTVYTWRTVAAAAGDIAVQGSVAGAIQALVEAVQGLDALNQMNPTLRDVSDAIYDTIDPTSPIIICSGQTFALAEASAGINIPTPPFDNRDCCRMGIQVLNSIRDLVQGNTIESIPLGMNIVSNVRPTVQGNKIAGCASAYLVSYSNAFTTIRGNEFIKTSASTVNPQNYLLSYDGFSLVSHNIGLVVDQTDTLPELTGAVGWIPTASDMQAHVYVWYGQEVVGIDPTDPQTLPFRWNDNDEVQFVIGATSYTYTFQRTAPGANQFNSRLTLMALINLTAEFAATNPLAGDPHLDGWILVKVVTPGAAGNAAMCAISTRSQLNGLILKDDYNNELVSYFAGGSANPDTTIVWTRIANSGAPMLVAGAEATGVALAPAVYRADVKPGCYYKVSHGNAAGGEEFWFAVQQ